MNLNRKQLNAEAADNGPTKWHTEQQLRGKLLAAANGVDILRPSEGPIGAFCEIPTRRLFRRRNH
jgi:hypothetical protein